MVEIAEEAANALILRSKCRESVLEYVYDTWLDAYEGIFAAQSMYHCTEGLRSDQATTRLLDRVFEKDQTETADVQSLLDLVIELNQCTPANAGRLLKYTDVTHFGKRERLAHQALLKYTGVLKETTNASECRVDLLCDVLDGLKHNSHFSMIQSVLQSLLAHKPSKWVSARLDGALLKSFHNIVENICCSSVDRIASHSGAIQCYDTVVEGFGHGCASKIARIVF